MAGPSAKGKGTIADVKRKDICENNASWQLVCCNCVFECKYTKLKIYKTKNITLIY